MFAYACEREREKKVREGDGEWERGQPLQQSTGKARAVQINMSKISTVEGFA